MTVCQSCVMSDAMDKYIVMSWFLAFPPGVWCLSYESTQESVTRPRVLSLLDCRLVQEESPRFIEVGMNSVGELLPGKSHHPGLGAREMMGSVTLLPPAWSGASITPSCS